MRVVAVLVILVAKCVIGSVLEQSPIAVIEDFEIPDFRIINGQLAAPGQFPYQILNKFKKENKIFYCGGALICDKWVLTAAHCVYGGNQFTIYLGSVHHTQSSEPGRIIMGGKRALYHKNYNPSSLNHDIALIELKQRVSFTNKIRSIPLDNGYLGANHPVTVSGWGRTSDNSAVSSRLNYVDLTTISNDECKRHYGSVTIINETLCTRGQNLKNTCNGDSGGPLVRRKSNGQLVHVGIVSFVSFKGCATATPSGFVRTASYLNWIKKNINGTCTLPAIY